MYRRSPDQDGAGTRPENPGTYPIDKARGTTVNSKTTIRLLVALVLTLTVMAPAMAAGFQLIDDGSGTKQVVHDGSSIYTLKNNGNIWMFQGGRWEMIDNGTGTLQIAADAGRVYALKDNGKLWRRTYGKWSAIAMKGSRQIAAAGKNIFTLEDNDDVWMFDSGTGNWTRLDNGTRTKMIAADTVNGLFVLKESGQIFHHLGGMRFELVDDGQGTAQIIAAGGVIHALKNNGNIWMFYRGQWTMVDDGSGTRQITADGLSLYALKNNGNIWMRRDERWTLVDDGAGTKQIEAKNDQLVVLKENGNVFLADVRGLASSIRTAHFDQLHGR